MEPIKEYNGNLFNENFKKTNRATTPIGHDYNEAGKLKKFEPILRDKKKNGIVNSNKKENQKNNYS